MSGSPGAGGSNARKSTSLDGHQHRRTEGRQNGNTDIARRLSKLYDALREAGASNLKAREAVEEAAAFENSFDRIERHLERLDGRMSLVQWMLGVTLVVLLGVFCRVFSQT